MSSRKSQVHHLLIYVLVLVVVALTLTFGVRYIMKIANQVSDIELMDFNKDMSVAVKKISTNYGSIKQNSFRVPEGYTEVCFVDDDVINNPLLAGGISGYPLVKESVSAGEGMNMFLIPAKGDFSSDIGVVTLSNEDYFYCYEIFDGILRIKMKGLGDKTEFLVD